MIPTGVMRARIIQHPLDSLSWRGIETRALSKGAEEMAGGTFFPQPG